MTPIFVSIDRYGGTYAGGPWWAVANADTIKGDSTRLDWVLRDGPCSGDPWAVKFWARPPDWIAVGDTPDQACEALTDSALRERLMARGPCHESWRDRDYEGGGFPDTFDWYGKLPIEHLSIMVAAVQNRHAMSLSDETWLAFELDWQGPLLGDENDLARLLADGGHDYAAGASANAAIRSLIDRILRRSLVTRRTNKLPRQR